MVRKLGKSRLSGVVLCLVGAAVPLLAAPTTVEVLEARNLNQRLWRTTETVAVEEPLTGDVRMEERTSQVVEVGDFVCYRDASGAWTPSSPRWALEGGVFVSAGVGYKLVAVCSSGEALRYYPAEDDSEVVLKLHGLSAVDGDRRELLRSVRPGIEGRILETDPTKLVYPDALGEAIDVEIELKTSGIHQNVVFRKRLPLPPAMSETSAELVLETEINLDEITAPSGRGIEVAGQATVVPLAGETTEAAEDDLISFCRPAVGGGAVKRCGPSVRPVSSNRPLKG